MLGALQSPGCWHSRVAAGPVDGGSRALGDSRALGGGSKPLGWWHSPWVVADPWVSVGPLGGGSRSPGWQHITWVLAEGPLHGDRALGGGSRPLDGGRALDGTRSVPWVVTQPWVAAGPPLPGHSSPWGWWPWKGVAVGSCDHSDPAWA